MPERHADRIDLLGRLSGEVMVYQPTTIRQISTGGMQVETLYPLQLDSLHDFRLTLGDRSIIVKGRVVHAHISDVDQDAVVYLSGVEFVEPSGAVSLVVGDFIARLKHQRAGADT